MGSVIPDENVQFCSKMTYTESIHISYIRWKQKETLQSLISQNGKI